MSFDAQLDVAATFFKEHDELTLAAHADADGICAIAILEELCKELDVKATSIFIEQVSHFAFERLAIATRGPIVFVDTGSSHLNLIAAKFANREVLILDHHALNGEPNGLTLVNPVTEGLDGTRVACAASLAWEVASRCIDAARLAPIAVIGAQADHQEPFEEYNAHALAAAEQADLIQKRTGARLYGANSKSLARLVATSFDLKIPEITGDIRAADRFIRDLDIDPGTRDDPRYYDELTDEERERLDAAIIEKSTGVNPEITHYTILGAKGVLADTREAASLMNACGRSGAAHIGAQVLRSGDPKPAERAQQEYKREIQHACAWFSRARRTDAVREEDEIVIIDAKSEVPPQVAGALCSTIVRGREVAQGVNVICLARNADGTTKISSRRLGDGIDLALIISDAASAVGGEGGGHSMAAGAVIPTDQEQAFVEELLGKFSL